MHQGQPGLPTDGQPELALSPLKRAFLAIEDLQARLAQAERARHDPIAVIGIGCRLPGGVMGPAEYWRLLCDGVDAVTEIPADRWDVDAYYDANPDAPGKMSTRWGGFISNVDRFDAGFFGIAPREAALMDPQQRLLLEVTWEALEHAGLAPDRLSGSKTGVFFGLTGVDYARLYHQSHGHEGLNAYYASGMAESVAAGRVSYVLGLQGPGLAVDTACSSSLVAVHLACQSLRSGESAMALAGGVSLMLSPENGITFSRYHMLASDGRCKAFDAAADGFGRGEGCGIVVLKRLADAVRDGNRVLAVIRGSALNQDGASSGLTAPNGPSQVAVIRQALADGGVSPHQVGYVEAHGTGTALGDPIEAGALGDVFGPGRAYDNPLRVGSAKTNLGHLEAAAGITGLIKTVLMLQHGELPATLHFNTPSPHIAWDEARIAVQTGHDVWTPGGSPRIAGVSSFGFSGTNAHVVLEEAPAPRDASSAPVRPVQVMALSARDGAALRALVAQVASVVEAAPDSGLGDLCYTANTGRAHLRERLAVVGTSRSELGSGLRAYLNGHDSPVLTSGRSEMADPPRVAFLFTGQGAQYAGMGWQLYQSEPTFRATLDQCADALAGELDRPLLTLLTPGDPAGALLDRTAYAQPALFAVEYALARLWESWGIKPGALLGHSLGEYVAACLAGVFTLDDGLRLVAERGRLMQALPAGGTMAAVFAPVSQVEPLVAVAADHLAIAAMNGPEHVVLSGDREAVQAVVCQLEANGIRTRPLATSHAFHSPLLDPMLDALERRVGEIALAAPQIRMVSNLTGLLAKGELLRPAYWREHARQPVRFADGVATLLHEGYRTFVEIGPHPVLAGMTTAIGGEIALTALPSLRRGRDAWQQILQSLGRLYTLGVNVDWAGFDRGRARRIVDFPTYPFQRERHWLPAAQPRPAVHSPHAGTHPLLGGKLRSALTTRQFEAELACETLPYLRDHHVGGLPILPAAGFIELVRAAADAAFGAGAHLVRDLAIPRRLTCTPGEVRVVQTLIEPDGQDQAVVRVYGSTDEDDGWQLQATASVVRSVSTNDERARRYRATPAEIQRGLPQSLDPADHYARLGARRIDLGASLQGVRQLWYGDGAALGLLELPTAAKHGGAYGVHPALLDAALQVLAAAVSDPQTAYLPLGLQRFQLHCEPGARIWCHARLRDGSQGAVASRSQELLLADLELMDDDGRLVAEIGELQLRRVHLEKLEGPASDDRRDLYYEVQWQVGGRDVAPDDGVRAAPPVIELPRIASGVDLRAPAVREACVLARFEPFVLRLEQVSFEYILQALSALGWKAREGDRFATDALATQLRIDGRYGQLLERFLAILEEEGVVRRDGDGWCVLRAPQTPDDPTRACEALLSEFPETSSQIALTRRCGSQLAGILRGEIDPLQVLFPGGSLDLAESLYLNSPSAVAYNSLVQEAVTRFVNQSPVDRTIRILEVGAGTGGTTAHLLPHLPADRTEYAFTDVSPHFLSRAREKFRAYPQVRYESLDLERDPEEQGFQPGQFDVIVSANAVHATADLARSLGCIHRLLRPGGLLALLEVTERQRWIDITFGLTDGWWRFTDRHLRSDYPLLDRAQWHAALGAAGFEEAVALPRPAASGPFDRADGAPRQALLLAQKLLDARRAPASSKGEPGAWIILADRGGVGDALAAALRSDGHRVTVVVPGASYGAHGGQRVEVAPAAPADFRRLLADIRVSHGPSLAGVVHLWSLDSAADERSSEADLDRAIAHSSRSALHLVQELSAAGFAQVPRLWLVTRNAQAVPQVEDERPVVHVSQSPLWGLGWTISLEHPELRAIRIDLDDSPSRQCAEVLLDEVTRPDEEDQVAWRAGRRLVARLTRREPPASELRTRERPNDTPVRLGFSARGTIDNLRLAPAARRQPDAGEIEIEVLGTGLNFKDVLNVLGMYPGDPGPLGGECSGFVVAVGAGVEGLIPGDAVVALAPGAFGTFVTAPASMVARKPDNLTFAEAAGFLIPFITAQFALSHLGHMRAGERVLIHAAAGGVGLAAVRLALQAGVEIFATAGSVEKRGYLRALGVRHVFDSRSLGFAHEIREATDGQGVDLVLNALTGEAIPLSLSLLRDGGRFLELGKQEQVAAEQLRQLGRRIEYFIIDWGETAREQPHVIRAMLVDLLRAAEQGALTPLPTQTFPLDQAVDAFRFMAQARHIGKIVLSQGAGAAAAGAAIRADATYLITGGLRGLGLEVAQLLVARGAQRLVLMGRSLPTDSARAEIARLARAGAEIVVVQGDVSCEADVERALTLAHTPTRPLRGVVHSAGVLHDGVLGQQTWERFQHVLSPKVGGSWLLHTATRSRPLDFFVLFSSAASLVGSAGQGNHVAANAFLDALAHHRHGLGLPATSVNWGGWSEVGAAAGTDVRERLAERGVGTISPGEGLTAFERLLADGAAQVGVLPVDWPRFLERYGSQPRPPFFRRVQAVQMPVAVADTAPAPSSDLHDRLAAAAPERRRRVLLAYVQEQCARILGLRPEQVGERVPLHELGLDSLMAVELRNVLAHGLGEDRALPATLVFDHPTSEALTDYLAASIPLLQMAASRLPDASTLPGREFLLGDDLPSDTGSDVDDGRAIEVLLAALEDLSEDEVERLGVKRMLERDR
ncbi:MAG: SDR family NAD(P)-dependent oxidoreductase [Chloroflexi bacterium]|nr:SDR family NAD(P)-dependent oxidoreductase [Chloroflexota bacterium]